jgi:hypothetical protein
VDSETLIVTDSVTVGIPAPVRHGVIFYPTDENTLQRNDPRQQEFNLREVPGEGKPAALKEVPVEQRPAPKVVGA